MSQESDRFKKFQPVWRRRHTGYFYSLPVVDGGRFFVKGGTGRPSHAIFGFSVGSGELLWMHELRAIGTPWHRPVIWKGFIAVFNYGVLLILDPQNGKVVGKHDVPTDLSVPQGSPALVGDDAIVAYPGTTARVSLESGEVVWRGEGPQSNHISPVVDEKNVLVAGLEPIQVGRTAEV